MTSRILHSLTNDKTYQQFPLPILEEIFSREQVMQVFTETGRWERRERTLTHLFMVYLLIAWTVLPVQALKHVCAQLSNARRWLSPHEPDRVPSASALCYRRKTLGVSPLRLLMRKACRPLCQPNTPGAFLFGRRLIAIDSKLFDVCESADTDWTFRGRTRDDQPVRHSPFPQVRLVSALEIGSHAHVGAVLGPGYRPEMAMVQELLTFLPAHSLILQDSGFRGAWWLQRLEQQGHDSITRIQATDFPCPGPRLPDGSYLVQVRRSANTTLKDPLTLRIIEYRLDAQVAEPLSHMQGSRARSGLRPGSAPDQVYRLATTLLDPLLAPVKQVAACYHDRWELELVYDELQEHHLSTPRLMSQSSEGVLQEVWALLLGHYAVRAWMMRATAEDPDPLDVDRLSFTQALTVIGTALTLSGPLAEGPTERWKTRLLADLRHQQPLLPPRRIRSYPRVIKTSLSRFCVKREKDVPFVCPDRSKRWSDVILPLHASQHAPPSLLI